MSIFCRLNLNRAFLPHFLIHFSVFIFLVSVFTASGVSLTCGEDGWGFVINWHKLDTVIPEFYSKNLRSDLFLAFVSAGAFLLSLKTFIVITMKKELFDTDDYKKDYVNNCKRAGKDLGGIYKPLRELNNYIYYAILISLLSSIMQVSIGFLSSVYAVFVCLYFAICASAYLVVSLFYVKRNLDVIIK